MDSFYRVSIIRNLPGCCLHRDIRHMSTPFTRALKQPLVSAMQDSKPICHLCWGAHKLWKYVFPPLEAQYFKLRISYLIFHQLLTINTVFVFVSFSQEIPVSEILKRRELLRNPVLLVPSSFKSTVVSWHTVRMVAYFKGI